MEIRTEEFHRGKADNTRTTILQRRRGEPGTPQPARRRVADSPRTLHRESTGTTGTGHRGDRRPPGRGGRTPSEEAGAATLARTPAVAGPSPKRLALPFLPRSEGIAAHKCDGGLDTATPGTRRLSPAQRHRIAHTSPLTPGAARKRPLPTPTVTQRCLANLTRQGDHRQTPADFT